MLTIDNRGDYNHKIKLVEIGNWWRQVQLPYPVIQHGN